jgi:hypothetical protein
MDSARLVRRGILLLPLAFLVQALGNSLGHQAFVNRYLGPHTLADADGIAGPTAPSAAAAGTGAGSAEASAAKRHHMPALVQPGAAGANLAPPDFVSLIPASPRGREESKAVSILDLHWGPALYRGHRVKLVGRLYRNERLEDFGPNVVLVYRFVITCCVADALPVTVLVDCANLPQQADADWVGVDRFFAIREHAGPGMLFSEDATATTSPEPERPYLY